MGVRPPLRRYLPALWNRRSFIWTLSTSRAYSRYQGSYLGQAWTVLKPILDAGAMVIIFGFVFHTSAPGIHNRIAFIVVGMFSYSLFNQIVIGGLGSIRSSIALIRSHQFPRAVVPLSAALTEGALFGPTLIAMLILAVLSGLIPGFGVVVPRWSWLLLPVAAALFVVFSCGVAMLFARIGARTPDIANAVPFFLTLGRYASGATFFLAGLLANSHSFIKPLILHQPLTVYLDLMRSTIGNEPLLQMSIGQWLEAAAWAVGMFVVGFLFFWGAEEGYGRD